MRAAATLLWCVPLLAQGSIVPGRPFAIRVHFQDDAIAQHAAELAAATWGFAKIALRLDPATVDRSKFEVHVYRDAKAYHAAGERLRSVHHRDAPGFADFKSRSAHFLLEEALDEPGLPEHAQRLLVHECMHLATYAGNPGSAFLPEWYIEGLALWTEGEVLRQRLALAAVDDDPYEQRYNQHAQKAIAAREFPTLQQVTAQDLKGMTRHQRYVVFRQLLRFLHGRGDLAARLWSASNVAWGPAVVERLRDLVAADTPGGLDALDEEFRAFVGKRSLPVPLPAVPMPVADAQGQPGQTGFLPGSPQIRWVGTHGRRELEFSASVTLRGQVPQADLAFERGGERWLRVTIHGGDGIHVGERQPDGTWRELGAHLAPAEMVADKPISIRVLARAGKLEIELAKKRVLAIPLAGLDLQCRWGLGGPIGSKARWSDVRLK